MKLIVQACRVRYGIRLAAAATMLMTLIATSPPSPVAAQAGQSPWEGPIVRQPAAETRLVQVINELRGSVYGLPAMAERPFAGADIDYITCIVEHNRGIEGLEHYPSECGRTVSNGGAEVLAWNWNSLGGTTNDLVHGWNNSDGHRHLMLGTGDQVSAGVFCVGTTAYGVAWFRRADDAPAQPTVIPRVDPPDPYGDLFGRTRFGMFGNRTAVCAIDGSIDWRNRPHSAGETPANAPGPSEPAESIDELITQRPVFTVDHADVLRLYRAYFTREPDIDGARYWLDVKDRGFDAGQIAGFMSDTEEFRNTFEGSTDRDFLLAVYRNALNREPDQDGFNYWLNFLETGQLDRTETVFFVAFGSEFRTSYPFGGK